LVPEKCYCAVPFDSGCRRQVLRGRRTEELLGATALLKDFDKARLQLLNGWDVVGEDTHLTGLGGNVDLDTVTIDLLTGVNIIYNHYG
jgi:hypothetical protein